MASTGDILPRRRVLIIVENLPVPFDRRVWQEATTLVRDGYTVSVICPTGRGHHRRYECMSGVHIHRHPLPLEGNGALGYALEYLTALFWQTLLAWRIFLIRGFDVVHACNPPDTIFLVAAPFKFLFGCAFVFDHHDLNPELYEAKFARRDALYRLLRILERLSFRLADAVIATNESYRDIALTRGGVAPENVTIVRSGPSLERLEIRQPKPELKRNKRYLVGYVGVMGRQEGISYLIEAARCISQHLGRNDVHFTLVGSGPELETLKEQARERGVDHMVEFTGFLPDDQLLDVLNTADVCVNPDEFNAMNDLSTMNKIMEYMALAKPIVQFDMTEGRRSAEHASLYARPNDAHDFGRKIVQLLDQPEKREAMGRFGRSRVERRLAWPHEAPKLLATYARVCNGRLRSRPHTRARETTRWPAFLAHLRTRK